MALTVDRVSGEEMLEANEMDVPEQSSHSSQNQVNYRETETSFINGRPDPSIIVQEQERRIFFQSRISETVFGLGSALGNAQNRNTQATNNDRLAQVPPLTIDQSIKLEIPKPNTLVTSKDIKRAGPYVLGPFIGTSPVKSILQCLVKKRGTDKYYTMKFLTLKNPDEEETQDDRQGKMLLYTEYSLLSMLKGVKGIIQHHRFFKDYALEQKVTEEGLTVFTGKVRRRLCLILDCIIPHDLNPRNEELVNLKHYVIKEKKLSEKETLVIFADTVKTVASFHNRNIVHRDLKLGNLILNRRTKKVTITNFCLGKYLIREEELLKDQLGSPAYISPDVLVGKPYLGKPSDMWALGVILFTMLYGHLPFYDSRPTLLFHKIKAASFLIPNDNRVSEGTQSLILNLLVLQPSKRLTAIEVLDTLSSIIATFRIPVVIGEQEQIVPEIELTEGKEEFSSKSDKDCIAEHLNVFDKKLSEFSQLVTIQEQMSKVQEEQVSPLIPQTPLYGQIPIHRVYSDIRDLTPSELERYNHLIPQENLRPTNFINREGNSRLNTDRSRTLYNVQQGNVRDQVMEQSQNNNSEIQDQRSVNHNSNASSVVPSNVMINTRSRNEPVSTNNAFRSLRGMFNARLQVPSFRRNMHDSNNSQSLSSENLYRQWPLAPGTRQMRTVSHNQDFVSLYSTEDSNTETQTVRRRLLAFLERNRRFAEIATSLNLNMFPANYSTPIRTNLRNPSWQTNEGADFNRPLEGLRSQRNMLRDEDLDRLISVTQRAIQQSRDMQPTNPSNTLRNNLIHRERENSARRLSQFRHLPYMRNIRNEVHRRFQSIINNRNRSPAESVAEILARHSVDLSNTLNFQVSLERRRNAIRENVNQRQSTYRESSLLSANDFSNVQSNSTDNLDADSNMMIE